MVDAASGGGLREEAVSDEERQAFEEAGAAAHRAMRAFQSRFLAEDPASVADLAAMVAAGRGRVEFLVDRFAPLSIAVLWRETGGATSSAKPPLELVRYDAVDNGPSRAH